MCAKVSEVGQPGNVVVVGSKDDDQNCCPSIGVTAPQVIGRNSKKNGASGIINHKSKRRKTVNDKGIEASLSGNVGSNEEEQHCCPNGEDKALKERASVSSGIVRHDVARSMTVKQDMQLLAPTEYRKYRLQN